MIGTLDPKIPSGALAGKWNSHKDHARLGPSSPGVGVAGLAGPFEGTGARADHLPGAHG